MKRATKDDRLRSDGKPRASAEHISAVRREAGRRGAVAAWGDRPKVEWRTIRVHADTYERLNAMRSRLPPFKGRAAASWDALFARLTLKRGNR